MRRRLRSRIKKRSAVVLALATAGALAAAGLASASHISNVSSLPEFKFAPSTAPKTTFVNGGITFRWHTNYAHPADSSRGGFHKTVTLLFDNDFQFNLNLAGIPSCTASFSTNTTIAEAWERCGPGADTPPEVNAYLSPPTAVSGKASTAPVGPTGNFDICLLAFKKSDTQILFFGRITTLSNATADCSTPGANTKGNGSGFLTATLSSAGVADFGKKLTFPPTLPNPQPLDDFRVTLRRGGLVRGRCNDANRLWNLRGIFVYSGSGQPTDTVNKTQQCFLP
jgi:hypothetical protein